MASLDMGLVISAAKGYGKTNALQVLLTYQPKNVVDIVIDYCTQHAFKLKMQVIFLNKDYLLKPHLSITNDTILDFSQTTKAVAGQIIRKAIKEECSKRVKSVIDVFRNGEPRAVKYPWFRFWFEESQDLIGRYLSQDDDLANVMAIGRNYRLSFGFITQRLADLNSQLVERSAFLVGKTLGDNNLRKLAMTLGEPRRKLKFIEALDKGDFVFYEGTRLEQIKFPQFKGKGRAYEIGSQVIRKKRFWQ